MNISDPWLTVLILAGGSLAQKQLGPAPALSQHPADLPDGSTLARARIAGHYKNQCQGLVIRLLCDHNTGSPRPHRSDAWIKPLLISPQIAVIDSVRSALAQIQTPWLLLVPITTLPCGSLKPEASITLGHTAIPREDWSAVSQPNGPNPIFLSKTKPAPRNEPPSHPFTGEILAPRELMEEALNDFISQDDRGDLLVLAQRLHQYGHVDFRFQPWWDLGHRSTYSQARLSRLSSRSFNQVHYEAKGDLIRKSSNDIDRLQQEHRYLNELPPAVRRYFPALVATELKTSDDGWLSMEMDYIPFPNLAELFLHWRIGANGWVQIARRLHVIRTAFLEAAPQHTVTAANNQSWLYSGKLRLRLDQLTQNPPDIQSTLKLNWNSFWQQPLRLTLLKSDQAELLELPKPAECCTKLLRELPAFENGGPLQLIHGDFCFNNILAEPLSGSIRLIDPRGEQPEEATWPVGFGDPRYDLIKLLHSSFYLYDVVVNGLFQLSTTDKGLQLRLDVPAQHTEADQALRKELIQNELNAEEERLLTSSLFFSMLPLHRSEPVHCIVLACIGILIFERRFDRVLAP